MHITTRTWTLKTERQKT